MESPQKPTPSNNFKVNSHYFIQQLDALIIQITRALAVEYGVRPDPDAKEMLRKILLSRIYVLMSDKSKTFVDTFVQEIKNQMKNKYSSETTLTYEFIKLMGADNV